MCEAKPIDQLYLKLHSRKQPSRTIVAEGLRLAIFASQRSFKRVADIAAAVVAVAGDSGSATAGEEGRVIFTQTQLEMGVTLQEAQLGIQGSRHCLESRIRGWRPVWKWRQWECRNHLAKRKAMVR